MNSDGSEWHGLLEELNSLDIYSLGDTPVNLLIYIDKYLDSLGL